MTGAHFPFVTRKLLELWDEGRLPNVAGVEVEPEYGYVARIRYRSGAVRIIRGSDVGLNAGAACELAKDKAYVKHFLRRSGFECPRGEAFLLPWWAEEIMPRLAERGFTRPRTTDGAAEYAAGLGFPVYLKPIDGAQGRGVWRCDSAARIQPVIDHYAEQRIRLMVVEEAVDLPDHRLVVLRDRLISAYTRFPLNLTGDGTATVAELLSGLQRGFRLSGRPTTIDAADARIAARLARAGLDLGSVPRRGETVVLHDISNLAAGGTALDVTATVHPRWVRLALDVTAELGLTFSGVDLACADVTDPDAPYSVLEVNSSPGLDHYGSVGAEQRAVVDGLYALILNEPPD